MTHGLRLAFAQDRGEPLDRLVGRLTPREQALARAIDPLRRRRHFALGRQAARRAITRLHVRGARGGGIAVLRGPSGEPLVLPRPEGDVRVSVSHSGRLGVACAWRLRDVGLTVGVDLERVRPTGVGDSGWAFDARERRRLASADDALAALRAWVAKEAAWKALGLAPGRGPEAPSRSWGWAPAAASSRFAFAGRECQPGTPARCV